jgi:hypothetical protein
MQDGTSNTIGCAERYSQIPSMICSWNYPASFSWCYAAVYYAPMGLPQVGVVPASANPWETNSAHPTSMQVLLMDGAVRPTSPGIDYGTWTAANTPNGGEVLSANWAN